MQWIRNNVVGLMGLSLIVGSSLVTLYIKAEVNGGAIVQLKETIRMLSASQATQSVALQNNAVRTAQIEVQISRFAKSNDRLILALDKLDRLYGTVTVSNAIQDEKLRNIHSQLNSRVQEHYKQLGEPNEN